MKTGAAEREFSEFVQKYVTRLYSFAIVCCYGDRLIAEDVLQDAFAKMWKSWPSRKDQLAWARAIIRNTAIDFHRKAERRRAEIPWDDEQCGQVAGVTDVPEEAIFRAMARDLWAAVATLEEVQQDLIYLIYVEQMSLNAARHTLGLAGTTATRYHNAALTRLREIIGDDE